MASHSTTGSYDIARTSRSARGGEVLPFPHRRVILSVMLSVGEADQGDEKLRAVFRSAVGVYVLDSHIEKRCIKLRFDIAMNDIDFLIHTLIRELPEATIGPLETRVFPRRLDS